MGHGGRGRVIVFAGNNGEPEPEWAAEPHMAFEGALPVLSAICAEAMGIDEALERTLDAICARLGWPVGHVYRIDEAGGQALLPAPLWHLDQPQRFARFRRITESTIFPPGHGLIGGILAERRPVWCSDVTSEPNFVRRSNEDLGVRACFAFPVITGGEVVAVCEFFSPEPMEADPRMLDLLVCAGALLGQAVERARWQAERARLLAAITEAERQATGHLARTLAHEINSPLLAARTGLALHAADLADAGVEAPLLEPVRDELTRIAEVMRALHKLVVSVPGGTANKRISE